MLSKAMQLRRQVTAALRRMGSEVAAAVLGAAFAYVISRRSAQLGAR